MDQTEAKQMMNKVANESRALMMMQQGAELALRLHNEAVSVFLKLQEEVDRLSLSLARAEQTIADLEKENRELRKTSQDAPSSDDNEESK